MLSDKFIDIIFGFFDIIVAFFGDVKLVFFDGKTAFDTLLEYGLYFFPSDVWVVGLTTCVAMLTSSLGWVLVEWVYKKIPGVD